VQLLSIQLLNAQIYPKSFYRDIQIDSSLANTISIGIENSNFLKNNEYFNDIITGYTLIGWFVNPKIIYYPAKKAKIEAGVHLLKYSGIDSLTRVLPTLSFQYKINNSIDVVIGTLYGTTNHNVIEPVFRYEYFFTDNIENGLQFLFHTPKYKGELWINWQEFIFTGEDKQEVFTAGLTNRFYLSKKESRHQLSIPLQMLFVHQGGQINETNKKLLTNNNNAVGLSYQYTFNAGFFKSVGAEQYYVLFNDMSGSNYQFPYIMGYGLYSRLFAKTGDFQADASWWYGDHYISLRGHPIFQSKSAVYNNYYEKQRALITGKLMYEKEAIKGLDIGAGFETYFDLYNYNIDYWYMFYINFNRNFFLKKFKQK
jgi:hypothetical protein